MIVAGIWFIGFSIIVSGLWISAELHDLCKIKDELDNIRLEIQYLGFYRYVCGI